MVLFVVTLLFSREPAHPFLPALAAEPEAKSSLPDSLPGGPEKELWVGPFGEQRVEVRMLLPAAAKVLPGERLTGRISLFDAAVLPVDSLPESLPNGRWRIQFFLPYDALSPAVLLRSNTASIDYRLAGALRSKGVSKPIEFQGRIPRDHVQLTESMRATLRRFIRVGQIHLTRVGLKEATADVDLDILAPFRFDLKVLEVRYRMDVGERTVSRGEREKFLLHGGRWNRSPFPIQIEYGGVLAAAGKAAVSGGQVDGTLTGVARLRLPSGELDFPFEFPVKLALL